MKEKCDCCGTCCRNGGPPLHKQDMELVVAGFLKFEDLVTVRLGEMVVPPLSTEPVKAQTEWIKLQGQGSQWCCRFLDTSSNKCTIYQNRPLSCRTLKCWDTDDILALSGQDLLCRTDLIRKDDPLLPLVLLHEKQVPVPDLEGIMKSLHDADQQVSLLKDLADKVQEDLGIRSRAVREYDISVAGELFYFGRPVFQILHPLGIDTLETPQGIEMRLRVS